MSNVNSGWVSNSGQVLAQKLQVVERIVVGGFGWLWNIEKGLAPSLSVSPHNNLPAVFAMTDQQTNSPTD
jgi:hypothetical protein